MNIGEYRRTVIVEPVEEPVFLPLDEPVPDEPERAPEPNEPVREPERVPA